MFFKIFARLLQLEITSRQLAFYWNPCILFPLRTTVCVHMLSQQIPASQNNLTCFRLASRFSNIPVTFESTWLECMFCNISNRFWGKDYTTPISHRESLSSAQFLNSGQVSRSAMILGRASTMPTQHSVLHQRQKSLQNHQAEKGCNTTARRKGRKGSSWKVA